MLQKEAGDSGSSFMAFFIKLLTCRSFIVKKKLKSLQDTIPNHKEQGISTAAGVRHFRVFAWVIALKKKKTLQGFSPMGTLICIKQMLLFNLLHFSFRQCHCNFPLYPKGICKRLLESLGTINQSWANPLINITPCLPMESSGRDPVGQPKNIKWPFLW